MHTIETLKEAIACLDPHDHHDVAIKLSELIEQMEQAESEPVAEVTQTLCGAAITPVGKNELFVGTKLYTHAPNSAASCPKCAECSEFLKEDETPLQRMQRDHKDTLALLGLLAKEKAKCADSAKEIAALKAEVERLENNIEALESDKKIVVDFVDGLNDAIAQQAAKISLLMAK